MSVNDYPGILPTSPQEALARFDELQRLVRSIAAATINEHSLKATLCAHLFSSIVRIHLFADGNGRVARLAVQYLAVSWGDEVVALPKVRNDAGWKSALQLAVEGEISELAQLLAQKAGWT